VDAVSICLHEAIADQMGRRVNIEIGGIDVIAGKQDENGVIDAIVVTFTTNANGVGGRSIVTIDGDGRILS
jgi:hypothetical protein